MKPAVLMMFRDEADILGECLEHWYDLGVRDFYLIDNRSGDTSYILADCFAQEHAADTRVFLDMECATDWPGRRVINELKNRALADGCDWIFPADADEFLVLPDGRDTVQDWLFEIDKVTHISDWYELPYLNILPDGRKEWQNPQMKCFGVLTDRCMISMGNHLIENVNPAAKLMVWDESSAHYRHYSLRTYPQFKRKMKNYMVAFSQNGFPDHHHAESFKIWQVEGEPYLQRLWTELTGLPCE